MAALTWAENLPVIPASELQPYAKTTTFSRSMRTTCNPERDAHITDFDVDKPEESHIMYLHRVFGFKHTSPDTMTDSDFETANAMALWSRCHHCGIIFKDPDNYAKHLRSKVINFMNKHICPQHPLFTDLERIQALFNCTICQKSFDNNQRPKKALGQHLKGKKHMASVNTTDEHREHHRLCNLVGISVD